MGVSGLTEKEAKMVLKALPTLINSEQKQAQQPAPTPVKETPTKKASFKATSMEDHLKNVVIQQEQMLREMAGTKRNLEIEVAKLKVFVTVNTVELKYEG